MADTLVATDEGQAASASVTNGRQKSHEAAADGDPKHSPVSDVPRDSPDTPGGPAEEKKPPGGYDATPLQHTEPGYTLRITFHKASKIPIADITTSSSDPYIKAILTADLPTRHKEDPIMEHRTRTIHKTTEPVWEQDWVVANVPSSGFRLKCRLYDEDPSDHDDRLGVVTVEVPHISEKWQGFDHKDFDVKKRMGSKRAYLLQAAISAFRHDGSITPILQLSIQVLGRSDPPGGRMYTIGPTTWVRHFSPMIGRLTGTKVNRDETQDEASADNLSHDANERRTKKYDFQANEIQLQGPVPEKLYHRYVEFRPIIGRMFSSRGLRGRILNKALHKQHDRIYNFGRSTEYGSFEACTEQASMQFLKLAHFDEGGRKFTYMISLDGVMRFTETGNEFGIDMLSKHSMHSDVATYIAFSGEFFIRRLPAAATTDVQSRASSSTQDGGGRPTSQSGESVRHHPKHYQLVIDNDSGTYRPDKSLLPILKEFLHHNFPGLSILALNCDDKWLKEAKEAQLKIKKKSGPGVQMVLNRSPSNSSFSSSDESRLSSMGRNEDRVTKSKKEQAWDLLEDPSRIKDLAGNIGHGSSHQKAGEGSGQAS